MRLIGGFFLISGILGAQPFINYRGIVNGASFLPFGLQGGEIARGSVFSIFGSRLGPDSPARVSSFPLQTTLAGVSIKVFQGTSSVDAYPLVAGASQINAIMPSNAPLGHVSIQVTYNGIAGNLSPAVVSTSNFGIFTANSAGFGPAIVNNFITQANQPINSLSQSAAGGQVVTLWGTGLGAAKGADNVAPSPGDLPTQVEIFVGGVLASKQYSGRSPCCAGVDQIVFSIPDAAPTGCYVPIQIRTEGSRISASATIAIQKTGGGACSDPMNPIAAAFQKGGNVGVAVLARTDSYVDVDTSDPVETTEDSAGVSLRNPPAANDFFFNPVISLPPVGACSTYARRGPPELAGVPDSFGALGGEKDAGDPITISGSGMATISRVPLTPFYAGLLGSSDASLQLPLVINESGPTTISAPGGTDVHQFKVSVPAFGTIDWTNRMDLDIIDRSKPLDLAWSKTGLDNSMIAVIGWNYDQPANASWTFVCSAAGSSGKFTIPAYILESLPESRALVGQSYGALELKSFPAQSLTRFQAHGLDAGYAFAIFSSSKTVLFQ